MSNEDYLKLSRSEIQDQLRRLRNWKLVGGKLRREIDFESFDDAISFMVRASLEITKLDHHPEWFNVYNRVRIELVTHDVGGVSNYDFILAKKLNRIISNFETKGRR